MDKHVIAVIADYLEAPHEHVALWDAMLVKYFANHPHVFDQFQQACRQTQLIAWLQAKKAVIDMS